MSNDIWAELERIGRDTGHVLCLCRNCGGRVMVSILNTSGTSRWVKSGGGWPRCKQCRPGVDLKAKPRVEPVGDVTLIARVRPGHCMTERELKRITKVRAEAAEGQRPARGPGSPCEPLEGLTRPVPRPDRSRALWWPP